MQTTSGKEKKKKLFFYHFLNLFQPDNPYMLSASLLMCQEVDNLEISLYPSETHVTYSDYYAMSFDQGQLGPLESDLSLTIAQKQKFKIQEISPEWGYANKATKVHFISINLLLCSFCN